MLDSATLAHGAVALGIGMLVGLERERKKTRSEDQTAAGLRTFAITSLLGYLSMVLAGPPVAAVALVCLALLVCMYYRKHAEKEPEITSEVALLLVLVLGALSLEQPELATAVGVVLTVLLTLRRELHHFVLQQLSEAEVRDGLTLLTISLVVLPLTPDRFMGPYGALNPHVICTLVALLMAVGAIGHIAMRVMGPRYGLPISAIASGFASGAATIAVLARQARTDNRNARSLAAVAVLSNFATITQFALVLGIVDPRLITPFWPSIGLGMIVTFCAGVILLAPWHVASSPSAAKLADGAFSLWVALAITLAITGIALFSTFLLRHLGQQGVNLAAFISGVGDAHAATASIASLVAAGQMTIPSLVVPAMMVLTGNTLSKGVLALVRGGLPFTRYFAPGQLTVLGAMWLGLLVKV